MSPAPLRKKRRDGFFFSLEIINPWLFWVVSCRGEQGEWGAVYPQSLHQPRSQGGHPVCHREIQPLGHGGGSFHPARGPEPRRVLQAGRLKNTSQGWINPAQRGDAL